MVVTKKSSKLINKNKKVVNNDNRDESIWLKKNNKDILEELEIASRVLINLQDARKEGIFGLKDNRDDNMNMIDERIDKLIEFIADEKNDIE